MIKRPLKVPRFSEILPALIFSAQTGTEAVYYLRWTFFLPFYFLIRKSEGVTLVTGTVEKLIFFRLQVIIIDTAYQ